LAENYGFFGLFFAATFRFFPTIFFAARFTNFAPVPFRSQPGRLTGAPRSVPVLSFVLLMQELKAWCRYARINDGISARFAGCSGPSQQVVQLDRDCFPTARSLDPPPHLR
jgi:hypothetical protein